LPSAMPTAAPPKTGGVPMEFRNLNTLDEPVCETIVSLLYFFF